LQSIILGIDSSDDFLSVGLAGLNGAILSRSSEPRSQNKNLLHRFLSEVLTDANIEFTSLAGVSVAIGPGSFTGLRVGLAVAKGICWSRNLPLIGVSSLAAIAFTSKMEKGKIVAVKDAKREEIYYAAFVKNGNALEQVIPDSVGPPHDIQTLMAEGYLAVGPGVGELQKHLPNAAQGSYAEYDRQALGGAIAIMGKEMLDSGKTLELASAIPNYVRSPKPREWKP
jgi:tRNA threonylcarbamoyladenosine biosynthesis protein TsaB